jgi:hypothetical protein
MLCSTLVTFCTRVKFCHRLIRCILTNYFRYTIKLIMADRGVWGTKSAPFGVKVGRYQMTLRQELPFLPLSGRHAKITLC